ncbi:cytochrome P450 monooxygenase pc-bph [Flagelloscypha sp. PMI_526]|nr:cytochrome P450 monooxygenase pc-bph [Flagelloscypha sp. PMI_526]
MFSSMDINAFLLALCAVVPTVFIALYLIPFLLDPHHIRHIPGPFFAKFSYLWLTKKVIYGRKSTAVGDAHKKYGPMVRISPTEVSIATSEAMSTIYAHGSKVNKSNFYHTFQVIPPDNVFNTTDRARHARKRKMMSHAFSSKSLHEMEPHIHTFVEQLFTQFDRFLSPKSGMEGGEGNGWTKHNGRVWMDIMPWCHFITFDIISKLSFGNAFGMVAAGQDAAPVPTLATLEAIQKGGVGAQEQPNVEYTKVPAIQLVGSATEFTSTIATLPPYARLRIRSSLSWFTSRGKAMRNLVGLAFLMASRRINESKDDKEKGGQTNDLLSKFQEARDEAGKPLELRELAAESLAMVIAGSDTSSNSMGALLYYLAANPHSQTALQNQLDFVLGKPGSTPLVDGTSLKSLPYLEACIKEGLRLLSTVPAGLPREVPPGGFVVHGQNFVEGTVLSVPSKILNYDKTLWGDDVKVFRPERWLEEDSQEKTERERAFQPFSLGPRACIGRNLAMLEMSIIMGNVLHRYEFVLDKEKMKDGWGGRETLISRPGYCFVGIKSRC